MPSADYVVSKYDPSTLHFYIYGIDSDSVNKKQQIEYFKNYFKAKDVKTIIVENNYVDRHYLEDYAEYYVRCFSEYKRFCRRIHFFCDKSSTGTFTEIEFTKFLEGKPDSPVTEKRLNDDYIGFIVIKPLPETVIGRTCLEVYERDSATHIRHYPVVRDYEVGLFGVKLTARRTLPFQEQDKVVAACATSALWSLFHAATTLKSYQIKSPAQITKIATAQTPLKSFPPAGLTPEMMGYALLSEGLEAHHVYFSNAYHNEQADVIDVCKEHVYAYLVSNIPLILGIDVYDRTEGISKKTCAKFIGKHAVTVSGFSLPCAQNYNLVKGGRFLTKATFIDQFYAHDDQVGPFSKISFPSNQMNFHADEPFSSLVYTGKTTNYLAVGLDSESPNFLGAPSNLTIGLYHKIRIPYLEIRKGVCGFNALFNDFINKSEKVKRHIYNDSSSALIWDIHLTTATDLKASIFSAQTIKGPQLRHFLTKSIPKYLWRARAEYEANPIFELLFDATDIPQGDVFFDAIEYAHETRMILDSIAKLTVPKHAGESRDLLTKIILGLSKRKDAVIDQLDQLYGGARFPLHIKPYEYDSSGKLIPLQDVFEIPLSQGCSLDAAKKYLWAVMKSGTFVFAEEQGTPPLGHPNLTRGAAARICGEMFFDHEASKWILNNASGRYSMYAPDINTTTLANVKSNFIDKFLPEHSDSFEIRLSEFHGAFAYNTIESIVEKCHEISNDTNINHDAILILSRNLYPLCADKNVEYVLSKTNLVNSTQQASIAWLIAHLIETNPHMITNSSVTKIISILDSLNKDAKAAMMSLITSVYEHPNIGNSERIKIIDTLRDLYAQGVAFTDTDVYHRVTSII